MTTPSSSVQGLASGIQWQDLIDQLIQVDTTNQITPITDKITANTNKADAWTAFGTAVSTLQATLKNIASGSAFDAMTTSASASPSTGRQLLSATATAAATTGNYSVQVMSLASAQQLSSNAVSDATAAMNVSGQIAVGGQIVSVGSTDSLNAIRDKINALNTGTTPSHISASILYSGSSAGRLVLTSDVGGSAGLDIRDVRAASSDTSVLTALGFIDGKTANVGTDGAVRSATFSAQNKTINVLEAGATAYPGATTINVNGRSVTLNVQTQSLADMAAAINAQSANSASVETVTSGGTTSYRLKISGTVSATADTGSQPTLDLLGLSKGTTGVVQQQLETTNTLLDASGTTATTATTLLGMKIAGGNGAQVGDTFTINGTKADGTTPVSLTVTVDGTKTIGDMLSDISSAFSASGRPVSATLVNGKIRLTDTNGGDSGLSFSIAANNESGVADPTNGASLSFGAPVTVASGRLRQLAAGTDARISVNGVLVTRNTNAISDAITGVTLNLTQAEAGTTVNLNVARDTGSAVQSVQSMVTAYNTLQTLVATDTASGGPLAYDSTMRGAFSSIKSAILNTVTGLQPGAVYDHAALVGLTLDKTGVLSIDTDSLTKAMNTNAAGVKALFQTAGTVTGTGFSYASSGSATSPGAYTVQVTRAATQSSVTSLAGAFTYAAGASPDTMTLSDAFSGAQGSISLVTGDTPDTVIAKLNAMFAANSMRLSATKVGSAVQINALDYGSSAKFSIAYASDDSTDVAGQLGLAAGMVQNGQDVQGTYSDGTNTFAATGLGQALTGAVDTPVEGLIMLYTGATNTASGTVGFSAGIGGLMNRVADSLVGANGTVSSQNTALTTQNAQLSQRQDTAQSRIDAKKAALTAQYTAMETAISTLQSQGTYLTQQINSLTTLQSSK